MADKQEAFETFELEPQPIRGFPELRWAGKRPLTTTQFFPAQRKETYGDPLDGWFNKLFWGDNIQVLSHLVREYRSSVDLIYIDPPFDSNADYKKTVSVRNIVAQNDQSTFEEKQYHDVWTRDGYLQFMYERLVLSRELLSPTGAMFVHVGHDVSHHMRCMLDEIFGQKQFVNEIIWRKSFAHNDPSKCGNIHDSIFYYSKTATRKWNRVLQQPDKGYVEQFFDQWDEEKQERYSRDPLDAPRHGDGGNLVYEWNGVFPSAGRTWAVKIDQMQRYHDEGRIHYPKKVGGIPRLKKFESEFEGVQLQDLWTDINKLHNRSPEATGYPTQKPEKLIERIIACTTDPGDLVLDFFVGSGTSAAAAYKTGRRYLAADINLGAIETTIKRLNLLREAECDQKTLKDLELGAKRFTGFELYNVNNYDIFRNPVEAKELIKEAMELQPLPTNSVFDGQRDQFLVKIMPVNRIATCQDLNEVIAGMDFKAYERRQAEAPSKIVDRIMLVCMGHEPDIGPELVKAAKPFNIEVEAVDLIRDKANLHFKRQSDAKLVIKDGHLEIAGFYPLNLLQKLSMDTDAVEDWRQLVETIKVDWNYDGAVLSPELIDAPDKNDLVSGRYPIPEDASTIRVKITDLLSESWEGEIENG